jgi:hypothetical protein
MPGTELCHYEALLIRSLTQGTVLGTRLYHLDASRGDATFLASPCPLN